MYAERFTTSDAVLVDTDFKGSISFTTNFSTSMVQKTSRHMETPVVDPNHARRRLTSVDYVHSFLLDKEDELSMILDPRSRYAENAAYAAGRKIDSVILTEGLGTAYYGQDGSSSIALTAYDSGSHVVTASSGLTVDKILEVKRILDLEDVDPDEQRYWVCTPYEIQDLLNTTEVKSSDYNTVKALAQGDISDFCGFKFIQTNLVARASSVNANMAFVKSGIQLGIKRDITVRIDERPDLNYATQIWTAISLGAVRLDDAKVVKINVTNS